MAFELPEAVYSPQLLEVVIYELEAYNEWYREAKVKAKIGAKTAAIEPNHSQETTLVIKAWQAAHDTTEASLIQLAGELKSLNLPVIHVTLATLPNHLQRGQLVRWFQQLENPRPLILFSADRTMGGGIIVRTPNHIYDWSFREKLEAARAGLGKVVANA